MTQPQCRHEKSCEGDDHPGWEHATSFEEIQAALKRGEPVHDRDGDTVQGIQIGFNDKGNVEAGSACITFNNGDRTDTYTIYASSSDGSTAGYILLPVPEVTDEDVQAAIASILGS